MARTKPSEQLSRAEIERFLAAAEVLHKSIVGPLLAYHSEHYQSLRDVHGPLLKSIDYRQEGAIHPAEHDRAGTAAGEAAGLVLLAEVLQ
ncbi:hypothetical protein NKK48_10495 [Mesorhizobium sp. C386A]|uniref:hypothetical protein n=1 Tax=unclassified Mesorhizobium TaxID=325217 RepID=UPI000408FE45|nr:MULTISPECIES: hypothetical protein [unclassified Mesorhizobium]